MLVFCFSWAGAGQADECDVDTLLKFKARAQCWYSNQEQTCSSLPLFAGTAGAAALAAKAHSSPEFKVLKAYLDNLKSVSSELARDYRTFLKSYYDFKKASGDSQFKTPMSEMTFEEYKKFEDQLKKKHPNNTFIKRFDEYGQGKANDIFQRTLSYAMEKSPAQIPMDRYFNTAMSAMSVDLERAAQIFREVSVEKGYAENGNANFDEGRGRARVKGLLAEQNKAIKSDLKAAQAGKATIGTLSGVALGAAALTPILDLNLKRSTLMNCAQSLGVSLSEEDSIHFSRAIELKGMISKEKDACQRMTFTETGVERLFSQKDLSEPSKKLMCAFENKYLSAQDRMDEEIFWQHESCPTSQQALKAQSSVMMKKDRASVITKSGSEIEIKWNRSGEWDYSSIRVLNDPDLGQYISDKIRHPLALKTLNSQHMNPRVLCGSADSGRHPESLCDFSKALRVASQVKAIAKSACEDATMTRGEKAVKPAPAQR